MDNIITDAQKALARLMAGNEKYLFAKEGSGNISEEIRITTSEKGQHPYATIITCSDSRVIPEKIFMTGIGEIFTIRVAGNVIGPFELGSVEYGAAHLHTPLIMVLGHSQCGAVDAAIHNAGHDNIKGITDEIKKAIGNEKNSTLCEKQNVLHSISKIKESTIIRKMIREQNLVIAGAYYHIRSGKVELL